MYFLLSMGGFSSLLCDRLPEGSKKQLLPATYPIQSSIHLLSSLFNPQGGHWFLGVDSQFLSISWCHLHHLYRLLAPPKGPLEVVVGGGWDFQPKTRVAFFFWKSIIAPWFLREIQKTPNRYKGFLADLLVELIMHKVGNRTLRHFSRSMPRGISDS